VLVKVGAAVSVGRAAIVCTEETSAVCATKVPIALGSRGGIGVGVIKDGAQETVRIKLSEKISNLILDNAMFSMVP
jgi:hypothetical protein